MILLSEEGKVLSSVGPIISSQREPASSSHGRVAAPNVRSIQSWVPPTKSENICKDQNCPALTREVGCLKIGNNIGFRSAEERVDWSVCCTGPDFMFGC